MLLSTDIYGSVLQVGNSLRAWTVLFIHWFMHPFVPQILIETPLLVDPLWGAGICAESQTCNPSPDSWPGALIDHLPTVHQTQNPGPWSYIMEAVPRFTFLSDP